MDFLQAVLIGIVHGLTVFLPVSSSGHTSLIGNLWNIGAAEGLFFEVLLHVAALLAVLFAFWKDVTKIAAEIILICMDVITNIEIFIENKKNGADKRYQKISGTNYRKMALLLIVAAIPMAMIGFLARRLVEIAFGSLLALAVGTMISVILLLVMDYIAKGDKIPRDMTYDNAIWLGICQGDFCVSWNFPDRGLSVCMPAVRAEPKSGRKIYIPDVHTGDLRRADSGAGKSGIASDDGKNGRQLFLRRAGCRDYRLSLIRHLTKYLQRARFRGFAAYSFVLGIAAIVCNFSK